MKPTQPRGSPARTGADRRWYAILARRIFRNSVRTRQRMKKNRKRKQQWPMENDAYGNPHKTWIPAALEKPSALPHFHTGQATNNKVMEGFKQESWTSGGLN